MSSASRKPMSRSSSTRMARSKSPSTSPMSSMGPSRAGTGRFRCGPASRSLTSPSRRAGSPYRPGGCTDLGCNSPPSTFGVADLGGRVRVVWHYASDGGERTFDLSYRLVGLAKAADDVVDVFLQVWGDEWDSSLDELNASMQLPGQLSTGEVLIWGHPSSVAGRPASGPTGFAQLWRRAMFPRASSSRCESSSRARCSPRLRVPRLSPEIASPTFAPRRMPRSPRPTPGRIGAGRITGSHSPHLSARALGGLVHLFPLRARASTQL